MGGYALAMTSSSAVRLIMGTLFYQAMLRASRDSAMHAINHQHQQQVTHAAPPYASVRPRGTSAPLVNVSAFCHARAPPLFLLKAHASPRWRHVRLWCLFRRGIWPRLSNDKHGVARDEVRRAGHDPLPPPALHSSACMCRHAL